MCVRQKHSTLYRKILTNKLRNVEMINNGYNPHLVDLVARHYPGLPGLGLGLAVVRVSAGEEACIMHGVITYIR